MNIYDKIDNVEINIKDTGIGIDKEHIDDIFCRYYQVDKSLSRRAEGSGNGLSLIKSIVGLHGGNISVDSKLRKGGTLKLNFRLG